MPRLNLAARQAALLLAPVIVAAVVCTCKSHAQTNLGDPTDVSVTIVDGTTGGPGTAERLTLEFMTARPNLVLDVEPAGSSFVLPGVPLKDVGNYVLTLWKDGVPYYFSRKGRELMGEPQTLHVFAASAGRAGVRITGLNVLLRHEESLLQVELLMQVLNETSPQVTVTGTPGSFGLALPAELTNIEASYHRGIDPTPVATARADGRLELAVPLVPGPNRVRLTGALPWREGMDMSVGSDLPIDAWSLLVAPDWSEVTSMELEPDADVSVPGYKRLLGPALDAGRTLTLRLGSGQGAVGDATPLFTEEAPAPPEAPAPKKSRNLPLPILLGVGVVLLLLVMKRRRA